jgi:NADPH:quinone reductase-like Zn-dependent oxidoreductase
VLTGRGGEVPTSLLMAKQVRLQGLIVGSRHAQKEMVRALEVMDWRPVLDRSFALEGLPDAFAHEESGAHFGKIVCEW